MGTTVTAGGTVVQQWDDATRTVRTWDGPTLVQERPYTAAEAAPLDSLAAADTAQRRRAQLLDALGAALGDDLAYLAIVAPTAGQRAAQVDALTRQMAWLIRIATSRLESM